jgi:hypothetical protein
MLSSHFLDDPERQKKILANFGLLQELGFLDYMDKVAGQLNNRETLLDEAGELFRQESLEGRHRFTLPKLSWPNLSRSYLLLFTKGEGLVGISL